MSIWLSPFHGTQLVKEITWFGYSNLYLQNAKPNESPANSVIFTRLPLLSCAVWMDVDTLNYRKLP